jgi:alpha-L-fucosidase 2
MVPTGKVGIVSLRVLFSFYLCVGSVVESQVVTPPNSGSISSRLWQNSVGAQWNDCFLIGNGRLGASIPGGAKNDSIWLNEDTFWNGMYKSRINPKALSTMPKIRAAVLNNDWATAQSLSTANYDGIPSSARNYNTLGKMDLVMTHSSTVSNYERWLDVDDATSGVHYKADGVSYFREYIATNPGDVIAIRIAADKAEAVSFSISLRRDGVASQASGSDIITMTSDCGGDLPIKFTVGVRVVCSGGAVSTAGSQATCKGADEAWIFVTAWTTVRQSNPYSKVIDDLRAVKQTYQTLREGHVKDYQAIYKRSDFNFGASSASQKALSTAQRVSAMSRVYDPELAVLSLQYARYLLIGSSRRGTLPANLQGIWNSEQKPMWGSRFTININLRKSSASLE